MDKVEAREIVACELRALRQLAYDDFKRQLPVTTHEVRPLGFTVRLERGGSTPRHHSVVGRSGTRYTVETQIRWEDCPGGSIEVSVCVDAGDKRPWSTVCDGFTVAPD